MTNCYEIMYAAFTISDIGVHRARLNCMFFLIDQRWISLKVVIFSILIPKAKQIAVNFGTYEIN